MRRESKLDLEIQQHLDTLEAIYFLFQTLEPNWDRLQATRRGYTELPRADRLCLRDELRDELRWVRKESGALARNDVYRSLLAKIRAYPGYYYLDKLHLDDGLFSRYELLFPRWKHIKDHAAVILDGKVNWGLGQVFELEGQCLSDARDLLGRSKAAQKGVKDFRKRPKAGQMETLMFARASLIATLNFVEAYLNGLAYDCFHMCHDDLPLEDHDLLAEWDSKKKKRRFVEFRNKVFRYPVIVGRMQGRVVDLSGCKAAHDLVSFAKDFRDALVHPSPFVNPESGRHQKVMIAVGANADIAETILKAAVEYGRYVESAIGNNPDLTAPWLSDRGEQIGSGIAGVKPSRSSD